MFVLHIFVKIPTTLLLIVYSSVRVNNEVDYYCSVTDNM